MSEQLPFEYSQRRSLLLQNLLDAQTDADKSVALQAIEEGDRELEDYLSTLGAEPPAPAGELVVYIARRSGEGTLSLDPGVNDLTFGWNDEDPDPSDDLPSNQNTMVWINMMLLGNVTPITGSIRLRDGVGDIDFQSDFEPFPGTGKVSVTLSGMAYAYPIRVRIYNNTSEALTCYFQLFALPISSYIGPFD